MSESDGQERSSLGKNLGKLLLALTTAGLTTAVALFIIRHQAPGLLGVPADLQLVQTSAEVPPFFENIFQEEHRASDEFAVKDPIMIMRGRPFWPDHEIMGPNDLLGFRNRYVPNRADVIAIGDSQTYGVNAALEGAWPKRIAAHVDGELEIYNMGMGGWTGNQYLEMLRPALHFAPKVLVVAYYTGNDAIGAFISTYGSERWHDLRPDPEFEPQGSIRGQVDPEDHWHVQFGDGTATIFTPSYRLQSNRPGKEVELGYEVLRRTATRIATETGRADVPVVFTIIPTKELAYAQRVRSEGLTPPADYRQLVDSEATFLEELADHLRDLPGSVYIDLVGPLQRAASKGPIYPETGDGHPNAEGYDEIARTLAPIVAELLPGSCFRPLTLEAEDLLTTHPDPKTLDVSEVEVEGTNGTIRRARARDLGDQTEMALTYGPYRRLSPGAYRVRFWVRGEVETPPRFWVDVSSSRGQVGHAQRRAPAGTVPADRYSAIELTFDIDGTVEDAEFRLWYGGGGDIRFDRIQVEKLNQSKVCLDSWESRSPGLP